MKMIQELYVIKWRKVTYSDEDINGQFGTVKQGEVIEFSYQDCINTYGEYCQSGYKTNYERLDENFSQSIKALDQLFILNVRSLIGAEKRGELTTVLKLQKENITLKLAIETVMRASVNVYDVDDREEQIRLKYDDEYRERKLNEIFESNTWKIIEEMEQDQVK